MSSESFFIDGTTFVPTRDFKYSKPKINKSGGKAVSILNAGTSKVLMLSTPLMLTWGISEFVDEKTGKKTYDMALQFPREDFRNESTDKFLAALIAFQNKIKADAIVNCKDWLNKPKMTEEVVDALFHPMLKYAKDPQTGEPDLTKSPTLKVKVDYWDDQFTCEIFDDVQNLLFPKAGVTPLDVVPKGVNVMVVIQCGGIWFANGKFGVTWKLFQAIVQPKPSMRGKCLLTVPGAAKRKAEAELEEVEPAVKAGGAYSALRVVEDSDEEVEQEPSAAPLQVQAQGQAQGQAQVSEMEVDEPAVTAQAPASSSAPAQATVPASPFFPVKKVIKKVVKA